MADVDVDVNFNISIGLRLDVAATCSRRRPSWRTSIYKFGFKSTTLNSEIPAQSQVSIDPHLTPSVRDDKLSHLLSSNQRTGLAPS